MLWFDSVSLQNGVVGALVSTYWSLNRGLVLVVGGMELEDFSIGEN